MMTSVVLALSLAVAGTEHAHIPGAFSPARGDVSMSVARMAPFRIQPVILMVVDTGLPALVAVGSLAGGVALGGALGILSTRLWEAPSREATLVRVGAGAALGSLVLPVVTVFMADVVLSSFHLGHLWKSRFLLLAPFVPGALVLSALLLAETFLPNRGWGSIALGASAAALMVGQVLLVPVAFFGMALTRERTDDREGSALWEEAE